MVVVFCVNYLSHVVNLFWKLKSLLGATVPEYQSSIYIFFLLLIPQSSRWTHGSFRCFSDHGRMWSSWFYESWKTGSLFPWARSPLYGSCMNFSYPRTCRVALLQILSSYLMLEIRNNERQIGCSVISCDCLFLFFIFFCQNTRSSHGWSRKWKRTERILNKSFLITWNLVAMEHKVPQTRGCLHLQ